MTTRTWSKPISGSAGPGPIFYYHSLSPFAAKCLISLGLASVPLLDLGLLGIPTNWRRMGRLFVSCLHWYQALSTIDACGRPRGTRCSAAALWLLGCLHGHFRRGDRFLAKHTPGPPRPAFPAFLAGAGPGMLFVLHSPSGLGARANCRKKDYFF